MTFLQCRGIVSWTIYFRMIQESRRTALFLYTSKYIDSAQRLYTTPDIAGMPGFWFRESAVNGEWYRLLRTKKWFELIKNDGLYVRPEMENEVPQLWELS
ncbi:hypothetical protein DC28_02045 [Spirochaeta lutea]|uniref:Uncharacterized protein n=1 Tax=Spirochaeta lutea TaxID=1480694 RepID=A0A098R2T3_9SPIO|nr:hypothetical protein DC28_02045 [Spirochaeta lutea]